MKTSKLSPKLLIATFNPGKVREFFSLLQGLDFRLVTPLQVGIKKEESVESGSSLEENAQKKALAYASLSGLITLADDSGLEVLALGGEPGVFSARFAGEHASDRDRIALLLTKLRDVPWEKRSACFRCLLAIAIPRAEVSLYEGECHGLIALEARGDNGFGYDPVFYFPPLNKTFGELPLEIKNQVSHRAQAVKKAIPFLKDLARVAR